MSKHATALAATAPEPADPAVARFLDAVWMERGLSANTLAAYRADLTALSRWLGERGIQMSRTTKSDLQDFIAARVEHGARPRSTARQLSSFRRFFRYLMREAVIGADLDQLLARIQEVEAIAPKMAGELRCLAEHFEYEKLLGLFGSGHDRPNVYEDALPAFSPIPD